MREYFSHDYNARNDKKMVQLAMELGMEGVGIYWCIIEMLYEESGYLMLSECKRIAFELRVDNKTVQSVINDFELFEFDDVKFWSISALERLNKRLEKSETARENARKRWDKSERNANAMQTHSKSNAIKVKESKEKKSIVNISFDEFWNLYDKKKGDRVKIEKKWLNLTDKERELVIKHIPAYKAEQPDKQYRKNPETYLNQRTWEDEVISKSKIITKEDKQRNFFG